MNRSRRNQRETVVSSELGGPQIIPVSIWWGVFVGLTVGKPIFDSEYVWPQTLERVVEPALLLFGLIPLFGMLVAGMEGVAAEKRSRFFLILSLLVGTDLFVWFSNRFDSVAWAAAAVAVFAVISFAVLRQFRSMTPAGPAMKPRSDEPDDSQREPGESS